MTGLKGKIVRKKSVEKALTFLIGSMESTQQALGTNP
jgi:hypothetical protein